MTALLNLPARGRGESEMGEMGHVYSIILGCFVNSSLRYYYYYLAVV